MARVKPFSCGHENVGEKESPRERVCVRTRPRGFFLEMSVFIGVLGDALLKSRVGTIVPTFLCQKISLCRFIKARTCSIDSANVSSRLDNLREISSCNN